MSLHESGAPKRQRSFVNTTASQSVSAKSTSTYKRPRLTFPTGQSFLENRSTASQSRSNATPTPAFRPVQPLQQHPRAPPVSTPPNVGGTPTRSRGQHARVAARGRSLQTSSTHRPEARQQSSGPDEGDDSQDEVVLALEIRRRSDGASKLGGCYYVAREEKLYFFSDLQSGGFDSFETVRVHVQPTVILLPSRIDEAVDKALEHQQGDNEDSNAPSAVLPRHVLDIRPSAEFSYENGLSKLADLPLPPGCTRSVKLIVPGHEEAYDSYVQGLQTGFTGKQGKLLALSPFIDFESKLGVGCSGAVLTYLQRRRAVLYLPGDRDAECCMRVSAIETVALSGTVSTDTLAALQIVQLQAHPNAQKHGPQNSGSKEDLSVYGLFHYLAKSPQGRTLLRQWFLRPSIDLDTISERHAAIRALVDPDNEGQVCEMVKSMGRIKDMRKAVLQLRKGCSNGESRGSGIRNSVWANLRLFAFYALAIRTNCAQLVHCDDLSIFVNVFEEFQTHSLATVGRMVTEIIDFTQSTEYHRTVVKPGIDQELDELKRTHDGLEHLLGEVSKDIASTIPQQLAIEVSVVFYPQIGFLICMPMDPMTCRAAWEGGPGNQAWKRYYSADGYVYYKDYRMHELDQRIGDVYGAICDKEIEIVYELAQRILEFENVLCTASDICGELDALLALAQGARQYKLTRPRMTTDNIIQIEEGRHILQELTGPASIPNDTLLVGGAGDEDSRASAQPIGGIMPPPPRPTVPHGAPSMLILTGPNYSGKSVYLKQVALSVYLAHVGSFVPATRATIGLTDRILTRVATRESVARPYSAFAIDVQQVATALRTATRRSIVLLDEFGKGTAAADGAGLLSGALEHLLARPERERARVLVATHFHELFTDQVAASDSDYSESSSPATSFFPPRPGLAFAYMDVKVDSDAAVTAEQVTYLYRLRPGRSLASLGMVCAALNGIDDAVVARAQQLIRLDAQGADLVAACAVVDPVEAARDHGLERVARRFLAADLDGDESEGGDDDDEGGAGSVRVTELDPCRAFLDELLV